MVSGGLRATSGDRACKTSHPVVKAEWPPSVPAFVCKGKRCFRGKLERERKVRFNGSLKNSVFVSGRDFGFLIFLKALMC